MARDGFNREIDYIRLSVTDRCNLSCIYCMPGKGISRLKKEDMLTAAEIARLARLWAEFGVRKVRLTGGEPLLREDITEIVSALRRAGVRDVSLTTNGLLLGPMARGLKEAGLNRVNISLDTLKPGKYAEIAGGGRIERALGAIEEAARAGLEPVKINMVPIRGVNDGEIEDFARLTLERPLHIRFIEFMPAGREALWDEDRCVKAEEIKQRVSAIGKLIKRPFRGKGPSRNYVIEGAMGIIGIISPLSHSFCYRCNRLRVSADGAIRPCLFARSTIDVRTPMRGGADDAEIRRLFELALEVKPEGGYVKGEKPISMSSIGG